MDSRPPASTLVHPAFALLLALLPTFADPGRAALPFAPVETIDPSINGPAEVVALDYDQDGDLDLLGAAENAGEIVLWRQQGASWITSSPTALLGGATALVTGDFDGNGTTDFAVGGVTADTVRVVLIRPIGNLLVTVDNAFDGVRDLDVADFDGDGDLDLVGVAFVGDDMAWFENDGDGQTWTTHLVTPAIDGLRAVVAADFDGDGDEDFAAASFRDDFIVWMENRLETGESWLLNIPVPNVPSPTFLEPRALAAGDVDGDGDLDLVVGGTGAAWFENPAPAARPEGTVWTKHSLLGLTTTHAVDLADLDHDGDLDALVAAEPDRGGAELRWIENHGGASSWTIHPLAGATPGARDLLAEDLDGDGDLDLVAASFDGDMVITRSQESIHRRLRLERHEILGTETQDPVATETADVDSDGDLDLVHFFENGRIGWRESPSGTIRMNEQFAGELLGPEGLAVGDIDRDGDPDVVLALDTGLEWIQNTGPTSQWNRHLISDASAGLGIEKVEIHDVDGNGLLDLLTVAQGREVRWWRNVDDGADWFGNRVNDDFDVVHDMVFGDVDGNGADDMVLAIDDGATWYEYFVDIAWNRFDIVAGAVAIELLDRDRDGDLDLVYIDNGGTLRTRLNDGDGMSWSAGVDALATSETRMRAIGDPDRDGDIDLVVYGPSGVADNVVRGFGTQPYIFGGILPTSSELLDPVDFDRDGDLDLVALDSQLRPRVVWNDSGQFEALAFSEPPFTYLPLQGQIEKVFTVRISHRGLGDEASIRLDTLALQLTDENGQPLSDAVHQDLFTSYRIHATGDNTTFEPSDPILGVFTPQLVNGVAVLGPLSASAELIIEPFELSNFFVVATVADREVPPIDRVDVRVDVSSSVVIDADFPNVALRPEVREQPVRTYYPLSSSVLFADGFESGDTGAWSSP